MRAALCGPGRARAAPTMARQAPVPGGDGLARARDAPAQARPGWPREIKWGCWLGGIRPPQRRYPAAIPGPPIVTKEASIQARAVLMGWRGPRPGAPTRPGRTRSCAPVAGRGGGGGGVSMGNEAVSAERGRWAQGRAGDRASREAGRRCPGTPRVAHPVRPGQCASAARLNVSSE